MKHFKNPVCIISWRDAAYFFEKEIPKELPLPQVTAGFIIAANEKFTNIATNVAHDAATGKLIPLDGFLIPAKAKVAFKKIGYLDEKKK